MWLPGQKWEPNFANTFITTALLLPPHNRPTLPSKNVGVEPKPGSSYVVADVVRVCPYQGPVRYDVRVEKKGTYLWGKVSWNVDGIKSHLYDLARGNDSTTVQVSSLLISSVDDNLGGILSCRKGTCNIFFILLN